jgi:hypothetical protein
MNFSAYTSRTLAGLFDSWIERGHKSVSVSWLCSLCFCKRLVVYGESVAGQELWWFFVSLYIDLIFSWLTLALISFQVLIGTLLIRQPFLIQDIEDYDKAKQSAFGAAGLYFFTFLLSSYYFLKESRTALVQGRGSTNRFGEYSNVAFSDEAAFANEFSMPTDESERTAGLLT